MTADAVDALLPQTQCTRCGYPACRPYAEAVAAGEADINRCPPGGEAVVGELARLLGLAPKPLDPACGEHRPREVAVIDEQWCIGCTVCIRACPVDAIVGARRFMHTVVADECSGCELCVEPCPVDCIRMVPAPAGEAATATGEQRPPGASGWFRPWTPAQAARARRRHQARARREARRAQQREARHAARATGDGDAERRQAEILAAVSRVRARRAGEGA